MKRFTLTSMAFLASLGGALAAEWKAYTYLNSAQQPSVKGLQMLADSFTKATSGEITIKINLAGSLPIRGDNITQAVSDGIIHIADDGHFVGNVPVAGVLRLPFLFTNFEQYQIARKIWWRYMEEELSSRGVKLLAEYRFPPQVIFGSKKAFSNLSDLKGVKIRVSSAEQGEFIKRVGGIPVTVNPSEVASALQTGVVSGAITASTGGGTLWRDHLTSRYGLAVNYSNSMFIINKGVWNKLSPDYQQKLVKAAEEAAAWIQEDMNSGEATVTAQFKSQGMSVAEPSPAEVQQSTEMVKDYWADWAKQRGPVGERVLAEILAALKK